MQPCHYDVGRMCREVHSGHETPPEASQINRHLPSPRSPSQIPHRILGTPDRVARQSAPAARGRRTCRQRSVSWPRSQWCWCVKTENHLVLYSVTFTRHSKYRKSIFIEKPKGTLEISVLVNDTCWLVTLR